MLPVESGEKIENVEPLLKKGNVVFVLSSQSPIVYLSMSKLFSIISNMELGK